MALKSRPDFGRLQLDFCVVQPGGSKEDVPGLIGVRRNMMIDTDQNLFNCVNNNTKIWSKSSSRVPVVPTNKKNTRSWVWSDASALWRVFFFCCTGSLICYDHKSFLPGTILLKCKFVSPSSHQPTGLDNKFLAERFVEMKRPVIFRCLWIAFFFLLLPPIFTVNIQFLKEKKEKEILTSRRPESSQSDVHQKNSGEEMWKIQTGEISRHLDALSAFLHTSATSLIAAFDLQLLCDGDILLLLVNKHCY